MPREVRIDDLFRLILPGAPAISPQGDRVAFCVKRLDRKENRYTSHLHVMSLGGRSRPRQLTHGLVLDTQPAWSPTGRELAFISDRDEEKSNIWILPLEGGEPRRLTKLRGGPIASLSWSPDGKELLFEHFSVPKIDPEERKRQATYKHITELLHKEDGFGFFRGKFWTIWKANAKTGRAVPLTAGDHHDRSPRWSPDSKRIVFSSSRREDRHKWGDQTDIFVMDRNGRGLKKITEGVGNRELPRWSTDGKIVYWVGYDGGPGEWLHHEHSVWRAPASGGKAEILNPGHDRWVANGVISDTNVALLPIMETYRDGSDERVLFGSDEDGCYRLYSVSSEGGDVRVELGGKLSVVGLSVTSAGEAKAVCVATTISDTGELYGGPLDGSQRFEKLTNLTAPFFQPLRVQKPEEFRFKSGKVELQGFVLKPPSFRAGKKYPCLIQVHGGPMAQYGEAFFHEMHVLAGKGWVVAYSNPRGSSGRGMEFAKCIEKNWGVDDWADVQALADFMAREPYVDAKRMGILGGSYGGFMTTWAVSHTDRFKAAVTMRQAGDYHMMYGSSDFGYYDTFMHGGPPWENAMKYHEGSPNFHVKKIKTPLLIIHNEEDLRCPIDQAESLFTAMRVLNQAPCEMIRFEGESHGLSRGGKPLNREERLKRIVGWFEKYL